MRGPLEAAFKVASEVGWRLEPTSELTWAEACKWNLIFMRKPMGTKAHLVQKAIKRLKQIRKWPIKEGFTEYW